MFVICDHRGCREEGSFSYQLVTQSSQLTKVENVIVKKKPDSAPVKKSTSSACFTVFPQREIARN